MACFPNTSGGALEKDSKHLSVGRAWKFLAALIVSLLLVSGTVSFHVPMAYASESVKDDLNVAVVNFQSTWGVVDANVDAMTRDIEQAHDRGVNLILFPEMSVTGYVSTNDSNSAEAEFAIEHAESVDGPIATEFSRLARQYDMWIVYGNIERINNDTEHAYNSTFVCSPNGTVTTYQKIHPVEGTWCVAGKNPLIFDTEWGKIGISMSYETYAVPELERYYASQGCRLILNPMAVAQGSSEFTDGASTQWRFDERIKNIAIRDMIYIASANLAGYDGSHATFAGGSCVTGPSGSTGGSASFVVSPVGSSSISTPGVYSGIIDLGLSTATDILHSSNFKPNLYTNWYKELANDDVVYQATPIEKNAKIATVNFQPAFGDKDANYASMKKYIEEAAAQDVNIIVFPEMALTGYAYTTEAGQLNGQKIVDIAEPTGGKYAKAIAALAGLYDMYIVFGTSEPKNGDTEHAYNSAFVCSPDGSVKSYRKIAPVEGPWCASGSEPLIVDTPYGAMGISICKDTYSYPELTRYYMAKKCTFLINPTARTGTDASWEELYENSLENIVDQDKMIVISADLCGKDLLEPNEQSGWEYSGASGIAAPLARAKNGDCVQVWGSFKSDPTNVGMVIADLNYEDFSLGCNDADGVVAGFNPALYSAMYAGAAFENPSALISPDEDEPESDVENGTMHENLSGQGNAILGSPGMSDTNENALSTSKDPVLTQSGSDIVIPAMLVCLTIGAAFAIVLIHRHRTTDTIVNNQM